MRFSFVSTLSSVLSMICNSLWRCYCCSVLSSSGITRPHKYYDTVRLPTMHQPVLALLSLVPALQSYITDIAGSPGLPYIPNIHHAIVSAPGKALQHLPIRTTSIVASAYLTASPFPFSAFEALSVQRLLTAWCLVPSVLNLWDYSRRPRIHYPVTGLPCRSGILTHWNIRPCPAALNIQVTASLC